MPLNSTNDFTEYALQNNHTVVEYKNINRSNVDLSKKTIDNIFKSDLYKAFKFVKNDGSIGIGILTEIIKPENQISKEFYKTVKNNTNDNFNFSISEIIGSEIIERSSYEIYDRNIDQMFM